MVLNCEGIDYISSSALGAVFAVYRKLQQAGRQLILASPQPTLLEVLLRTFQTALPSREGVSHH